MFVQKSYLLNIHFIAVKLHEKMYCDIKFIFRFDIKVCFFAMKKFYKKCALEI